MAEYHSLAKAFQTRVATQTVLIKRLFKDDKGRILERHGTGVIISHGVPDEDAPVHIVTAGHVLDGFGGSDSQWAVQRIELDDDGVPVEFNQTFHDSDLKGEVPNLLCTNYLRDCDIALLLIENRSDGEPGRKFIDSAKHKRLKVVPTTGFYLHPGAKVAWCGFPGFVKDMTDGFQLCYFEGVVSCAPQNPPVYLVDGHTAGGVSGGPMWLLADDGDAIITGVCIHYAWPKDFPGLVGFCPLQVLLRYIEKMQPT